MLRLFLPLLFLSTTLSVKDTYDRRNRCKIRANQPNSTYRVYCLKNNYQSLEYLPPNTTRLSISGNDIEVLQGAPFRNLTELKVLILIRNKLKILTNDSFEGLHQLQELVLKDNFIKSIDEDVFKWCPLLTKIDFSANYVIRLILFAKAMAPLTLLTDINFSDNLLLQTVGENDLRPLNNSIITNLILERCQLRNLAKGSFSHLRNLTYLTLSTNPLTDDQIANSLYNITTEFLKLDLNNMRLTEIPTTTLQALSRTKVQILNMQSNRFTRIRHGTIPRLPNLRHLNLRQCDIEQFIGLAFANLTSLEELDIRHNRLFYIPLAIRSLKTLKVLDMSSNQFPGDGSIEFDLLLYNSNLSRMVNLEVLNLNDLRIGFLKRHALYGLTKLKTLRLAHSVNEIEEFAFESLHNLDRLILAGNLVFKLIPNLFKGLNNLTYLDLQATRVTFNPNKLHFHNVPNLITLILSHNELTSIPHRDIEILTKLELLLLRSNAIIPWTDPILFGKKLSLQAIDLSRNNLDHVTPAMMRDFNTLEMVDISSNPYNCSKCVMHEFAKWLNSTENITNRMRNYYYMQCVNPNKSRDMHVSWVPLHDYCIVDYLPLTIALSTSLTVISTLVIVSAVIGYKYRWYFRYYWFLTRARVKRLNSVSVADKFQYDAFVSYNVSDQDWLVNNLLPKLESEEPKFKLCLHERDFIIGKEIISNIVESIDNSRFIVLMLSKNFLSSQWCTWEMNMAQFMSVDCDRDALILVMLEPISKKEMSATLKYLIKTRTYLEWTENVQGQKLFWERLRFAIRRPAFGLNEQTQTKLI